MNPQNELSFYFIPSPYGIDWSSPGNLLKSIAKNNLSGRPRFMGHVNIELRGRRTDGREISFLTGMVASKLNARPLVLWQGMGLSILFHSFPGRLETRADVGGEIQQRLEGSAPISHLSFSLNSAQVDLIDDYISVYTNQEYWKAYGLYHDPLKGEGAGCSAFGVSFLRVLNTLQEEWIQSWSREIYLPLPLLGRPITAHRALPWHFLKSNWAQAEEWGLPLFFWDPDLMVSWVETKKASATESELSLKGKTLGLAYSLENRPVPPKVAWECKHHSLKGPVSINLPQPGPHLAGRSHQSIHQSQKFQRPEPGNNSV